MAYKNLELRRQRGREAYQKHREQRLKYAHEYYIQNLDEMRQKNRIRAHENRKKYHEREHNYYLSRKEQVGERCRAYYQAHKEEQLKKTKQYHIDHYDELEQKRIQAKAELRTARCMCPAFKFLDKMRLTNTKLYLTKFKPHSNLGHIAAKKCAAIQNNDYTLCPICNDCTISGNEMEKSCPMPHVFEFENAASEIRSHAADIVMANQK